MDSTKRNSRVPELRFPEFEKEWEEKSFGELYEKHNVKNDLSFGVDKIISVANMYYKEDANVGNEEYLRSYNVFRIGDIAYEGHKSAEYSYGRFVENTIGDGIVSHIFDVYSPLSKEHNIDYWKHVINYERIMRPVLENSTKQSTMMNNLIAKDFFKQRVLVPSVAEQRKIADCLSAVDELISAQDQKVKLLKERKQGLMQQLFPQNSEATPRLRFPGFSGEWEKKLFKDITDPAGKKNRQNLPYERYSISNEVGFYPQSVQFEDGGGYLKDIDCRQYIIVPPRSFAYNPARINVGSIGYQNLGKDVIVSSLYEVFQTRTDCIDSFLWQWFHTDIFHKMVVNVQEGGVRQYFFYEKLKECAILLPSFQEQKKIADCLTFLDEIIASEEKISEYLKICKKGLMQQIFPVFSK